MMKVIDVIYYSHNDFTSTKQVIEKHAPSLGYVPYLKDKLDIELIKHFKHQAKEDVDGLPVMFFKRRNKFWDIPFKTHRYIRSAKPDIVIIEGLVFPLQLIVLKLLLGRTCSIVVQHHGESPYSGLKKMFQIIADRCTSAYMFTSKGNSQEWIEQKIIKDEKKCYEVLEASTYLSCINKQQSRKQLGIQPGLVFLWVGRLNEKKDPLTVLEAFEKYLSFYNAARMYMIYHTEEMLPQIKKIICSNQLLKNAVTLVGKVLHSKIAAWYSAADFYISASHKEAGGYALLEAMACGCIPIVTCIPPFKKITANGKIGFLYPPGDAEYLFAILKYLPITQLEKLSADTVNHFTGHLSFKNIADDIHRLCLTLPSK